MNALNPQSATALPGHPHIARDAMGALCVEALPLADLARTHGTPLFVYSKQWMLDALAAYQRGFEGRDALVEMCGPCGDRVALPFPRAFERAALQAVARWKFEATGASHASSSTVQFDPPGQ